MLYSFPLEVVITVFLNSKHIQAHSQDFNWEGEGVHWSDLDRRRGLNWWPSTRHFENSGPLRPH